MERLWNANYTKVWWANFMIFFSFMITTPLLPLYLSEEFHADKDTIGLVLSGYTLTALLARPFSGFLVDSFPRKVVLLICYFLFFVIFAGYIVAGSLALFAIVRTMHGAPMGATAVCNSTMAIDVLHPTRRSEGIGYYGLSNNLATAMSPTVGLWIYHTTHNFDYVFLVAFLAAGIGFAINCTVKTKANEVQPNKDPISWDRFFLLKGTRLGITMACLAFSYGVISTYLAVYGKEKLGMTSGTGLWFALLCVGLMSSRLVGARSLRKGKALQNASGGMLLSVFGYLLFASVHNLWGYYGAALIVGWGNGHMWPAFQTMFINLAPNNKRGTANSTLLTAWDTGIGFVVLGGGCIVEYVGYNEAFWAAWIVNAIGVIFFFALARRHFILNKLR